MDPQQYISTREPFPKQWNTFYICQYKHLMEEICWIAEQGVQAFFFSPTPYRIDHGNPSTTQKIDLWNCEIEL